MKQKMQEAAFMIIAYVGTAKSMYIEALRNVKQGKYEHAQLMIEEADNTYAEAHKLHFEFIQAEASGEDLPFSLMLMHAEDQLLNTETVKLLVEELIEIYKKQN